MVILTDLQRLDMKLSMPYNPSSIPFSLSQYLCTLQLSKSSPTSYLSQQQVQDHHFLQRCRIIQVEREIIYSDQLFKVTWDHTELFQVSPRMVIPQVLWTPALGLHHCHGHVCRGKITQNFLHFSEFNTFQAFNVIKIKSITLNSQAMVSSNGFSPLASRHKELSHPSTEFES